MKTQCLINEEMQPERNVKEAYLRDIITLSVAGDIISMRSRY